MFLIGEAVAAPLIHCDGHKYIGRRASDPRLSIFSGVGDNCLFEPTYKRICTRISFHRPLDAFLLYVDPDPLAC